jgi:uncharacterized protein (UPF0335 family)
MNDAASAAGGPAPAAGGVAAERLRSFVQRIERLEEDKANIAHDIREVYSEAKGEGFDVKVLRKIISLRKKDPQERREEDELLELYMSALGE